MKMLLLLALTTSTLFTSAFAAETKTECPWMKEMNKRSNPKANLVAGSLKHKNAFKAAGSTRQ